MKYKIITTLLLLMFVSSYSYASFPVKKQKETVALTQSVENDSTSNYELASSAQGAANNKSQLTALLLSIFVGWLGVHRYYLGYIWQGVVQTLTFGVFGIWTLIDLIRIATGDLQPKSGPYGKPFGSN
jgi:hypothetical protein